jgi:hypothetical protein
MVQVVEYEQSMLDVIARPRTPREKILELEAQMRNMPQIDCPLQHHYAPGLYAREILLPKGSLVVGKIHKHAHINTISRGHVTVYTEFGESDLIGPTTFTSKVGTKRVVLAHEDTIWTTYHVTEETDLDKIEEHVIAKSYDDVPLLTMAEVLKIEGGEK